MAVKVERIEQPGGGVSFQVTVPRYAADAFEESLKSLAALVDCRPPLTDSASLWAKPAGRELPGKLLKRLRTEAGMTQRQAAEAFGTTQSRISDFEMGVRTIPLEVAERMARRFGVRASDFSTSGF